MTPPSLKAGSQTYNGKLLLDDVVAGRLISTRGAGALEWLKDGERYSRLEPNADGGKDVVAYRAKDNRREVLIPAEMFTDKSTYKRIPVRSISWSADNDKVLVYTNTRKVWRYDTRGDYWVLIPADGTFRQARQGATRSITHVRQILTRRHKSGIRLRQ